MERLSIARRIFRLGNPVRLSHGRACELRIESANEQRIQELLRRALFRGHFHDRFSLMTAEVRIGTQLEHPPSGEELLVVQGDMERRPAGGSARNRGAAIDGVDVGAMFDEGIDHSEPLGVLPSAAMRTEGVSAASGPVQGGLPSGVDLVGIGAGGNERSDGVDVATMRHLAERCTGLLPEERARARCESEDDYY